MKVLIALAVIASALWLFGRYVRHRAHVGVSGRTFDLVGNGRYEVDIVGESNYQPALQALCGAKTEESAEHYCVAHLVLDDGNKYDSLAVRVDIEGRVVGYLSRSRARQYREILKRSGYSGATGIANAVVRGGWKRGRDEGSFGVWLDV